MWRILYASVIWSVTYSYCTAPTLFNIRYENMIYTLSIFYILFGFLMINLLCGFARDRVRELIDEYTREDLFKILDCNMFDPVELLQLGCSLCLIYFGGHFLAMSLLSVMFVHEIFIKILKSRISTRLMEELNLPTECI